MKIHLISDTHLEMRQEKDLVLTATGDVCVCAGDIGSLGIKKQLNYFFEGLFKNFDHVIYVLGNHEYYNGEIGRFLEIAHSLEDDFPNLYVLDIFGNPSVAIDGVKFWGTTFWTNIDDWLTQKAVENRLNDFRYIHKEDKIFKVGYANFINYASEKLIDWTADVIVTHHAPIYFANPRFDYDKLTHAFYNFNNDLTNKIKEWEGKFWLFGHTHHNVFEEVNKTLLVSNCLGYQTMLYNEEVMYDPNLILEV